jgi:hypothetical protein
LLHTGLRHIARSAAAGLAGALVAMAVQAVPGFGTVLLAAGIVAMLLVVIWPRSMVAP